MQEKLAEFVQELTQRYTESHPKQGSPEASYAHKAAHPKHRNMDDQYSTLDYLSMDKKIASPRPSATETNGALARVYVKDWRREPVGAVKRALRAAIA